jgi:hypothetical protein
VQLVKGLAVCSAAGCCQEWKPFSFLDALARSPHQFVLLTKRPRRMADFSRRYPLPPNVWPGTSVTNQSTASRLDALVAVAGGGPLVVSAEPLHGPVDLSRWLTPRAGRRVRWVIAGGESGPAATPCNVQWLRVLRDQCRTAGVAFFCKQLGSSPFLHASGSIDQRGKGVSVSVQALEFETSIALRDSKGGDPSEWPADLRVRELPAVAV